MGNKGQYITQFVILKKGESNAQDLSINNYIPTDPTSLISLSLFWFMWRDKKN